ncbi:MAG: winged helix-turn-helix domain-containing protein [Proteobacteria bacterium]|nr:winged helix-turn-helix domain-containing protein [Pseudomonadota bacterium]MBU1737754.1 winged helix-turn-helix domain-containing protein [Pseudomonadota bacterium]
MNIPLAQHTPPELDRLIASFESKVFKSITEPARAAIIKFLMLNGRADISTIASHLPQDRSVISRHLNMMAEAGILIAAKETRHMYYSLNCRAFLDEFERITQEIRECMAVCCPPE